MNKPKKSPLELLVDVLLVLCCTALFLWLSGGRAYFAELFDPQGAETQPSSAASATETAADPAEETLELHVLDVGQGLSLLLRCGGETLLLDAGEYEMATRVVNYLHAQDISALTAALNTHPHYDHYGGLRMTLTRVPAERLYTGAVPVALLPAEAEYARLLDYLLESETPCTVLSPGDTLTLGGATLTVLGPLAEYEDLNNMSLVLRVSYGETAFLLTGDMQAEEEADLLGNGADLSADVLVVGHHGSGTSTTPALLSAVAPQYAAISVGTDNDYGFPHDSVLRNLADAGVQAVLRTDLDGNIVFTSDGGTVTVTADKQ